ncbi:hypothetical protein [Actinomadura sp. 21ATH]|uniref:hypothetical protein n=1 Tax=Actinomadura sp. 21ATH TaxID=1735444 RepID=UPI0035BF75EC
MIFLGLLVAACAVVAGAGVVAGNAGAVRLTLFGEAVPGVTEQWQVFMAGVVVAVLFVTGVLVATLGLRRAMDIRRELRELRDEHEESMQTLEMEKRQLQRELAKARGHVPAAPN